LIAKRGQLRDGLGKRLIFFMICGMIKVMKRNKEELEISQRLVPLQEFLESYNQNIPAGFPRASVKNLKKFQDTYPSLFKNGEMWSVAVHRKKIMDWLPGHNNNA